MATASISWEEKLFKRATVASAPAMIFGHNVDRQALDSAYQYCAELTYTHSRTFHMSSGLLPKEMRSASRALYTFCRITDDIVDQPGAGTNVEMRLADLQSWRRRSLECSHNHTGDESDPAILAWTDTRARYGIPKAYAEQLIEGVAQDMTHDRYANFDDLAHYCYLVASTVGLMTMHIVGYAGSHAIPYAIKLGVALQLTNILRDVGEDLARGRIYLPLEDLAAFDYHEADLIAGRNDERFKRLMRFQIERTEGLYRDHLHGLAQLKADGRMAVGSAILLYRGILGRIIENDFDVFSRRARLSTFEKLARLPTIYRQVQRLSLLNPQAVR